MTSPTKNSPTAILSNVNYAFARQSATIILPAIGTLYFMLAGIWGLPYADNIVGSIAALNLFVGVLVGVAKKIYDDTGGKYDGTVDVEITEDGTKRFSLNLDSDPDTLDSKNEITFRVNTKT